ncbi:MAG: hypothetical protein OXQ31_10800 [Spirochaetaceae bacterium]|nr:hypothetical protein [Spirochaetaceae bacterium]
MKRDAKRMAAIGPNTKKWWITAIVVPVMIAMLSAGVSWQIARTTAMSTIANEFRGGENVFNDLGHRYFAAVYYMHDHEKMSEGKGVQLVEGDAAWRGFRSILAAIADDMTWLRRNPVYEEISVEIFPYMHNFVTIESVGVDGELDSRTLQTMCDAFVKEGFLKAPADAQKAAEIVEFAYRVCNGGT